MVSLSRELSRMGLVDALILGVLKFVLERVTAPVIGNGTYMSGAIKIGASMLVDRVLSGKIGNMLSTALMLDGVEDIAVNVATMIPIPGAGQAQSEPFLFPA